MQVDFKASRFVKAGSISSSRGADGFSLPEALISFAIVALVFGGVINGYIQSALRAKWTSYSLAAQSLADQQIEQSRSAVWDIGDGKNEVTNLNLLSRSYNKSTATMTGYSVSTLDVPLQSTNLILATNYVTVRMLYVDNNTNIPMQMVEVKTVWPFQFRQANLYFTNSMATYLAPDDF